MTSTTHTSRTTEWAPCRRCGAMTRHDDGFCYRDPRSPVHHPSLVHASTRPLRKRR